MPLRSTTLLIFSICFTFKGLTSFCKVTADALGRDRHLSKAKGIILPISVAHFLKNSPALQQILLPISYLPVLSMHSLLLSMLPRALQMLHACKWKQHGAADHGRISLVKFSSPEVFSRAEPSNNKLFQGVTSSLSHAESSPPMLNQQT